jgi:hypothetical protein
MTGEARYLYKHKIPTRTIDLTSDGSINKRFNRTSITFRKVRKDNMCDCAYKEICDYQNPESFHLPDGLWVFNSPFYRTSHCLIYVRSDIYKIKHETNVFEFILGIIRNISSFTEKISLMIFNTLFLIYSKLHRLFNRTTNVRVVDEKVDVNRYLGTWYQVCYIKNNFQNQNSKNVNSYIQLV